MPPPLTAVFSVRVQVVSWEGIVSESLPASELVSVLKMPPPLPFAALAWMLSVKIVVVAGGLQCLGGAYYWWAVRGRAPSAVPADPA